ncbi:MAG: amidohydrolase family protein [Bacteroidota bacterium]
MRIDSHNHFWKYDPARHGWIDDSMRAIRRDFLPEDFDYVLKNNHMEGTIAVQADQTEEETSFLLGLADQYDFIKGVVGWVDLRSEKVADRLRYFSQFDKLVGFRHIVQAELDPSFMLREDFQRGLSALGEFDFTYDILVYPHQLEAALKTIELHPHQKFVIDHIAKPEIATGIITEWSGRISQIADFSNVMCKLSGLITEADWQEWRLSQFTPYLDEVMESFGIDRVMFGSDWPVCLLAGSYNEVRDLMEMYFDSYSIEDKKKIFGLNAMNFYGVK